MSKSTNDPRRDRLKAALRDNLKRRKEQARSRAAGAPATGENDERGARTAARRDRQGPEGD